MKYLNDTVAYLQISDFDSSGRLVNPKIPSNIPVVVMIQAAYCGHCTSAKPAFQEFANSVDRNKVFVATIQADGDEPGEKELGAMLSQIKPDFRGFPDYALFLNGRLIPKQIQGRDVASLREFAKI